MYSYEERMRAVAVYIKLGKRVRATIRVIGGPFTLAQFIDAVDGYIRWYNETRIKMSLGGRSPIEFRQSPGIVP